MKSNWDDVKNKTPDDIIREIDYAVHHAPPIPTRMWIEFLIANAFSGATEDKNVIKN